MLRNKLPENLKATIALGISSFAASGINYAFTPIISRMMSTSEYGLISVYNSVYAILSVIATLTLIKPGLLSVGMYEHKENRWRYLSSLVGLITVATAIVAGGIAVFWHPLEELIALPPSLVVLIMLTCWLNPAFVFWTYKQKYEYRYKSTFVVTVFAALFSQLVSITAIKVAADHGGINLGIARLWGQGAVNIIVAIVLAVYIVKQGKCLIDLPLWRVTTLFALPLIPHYLGFAFLNGSDRLMIRAMVGIDKAGIYSLAAVISTIGMLAWSALCITITPFVNEMLGTRRYKEIGKQVNPLMYLIGGVCILVTLLAPEVIALLGPSDYQEGVYVVPATVAGVFLHIVYDLFANVSFFHKKTMRIMVSTIVAAITNIVLNYVFIRKYGYIAASFTTLFSFLLLAVLHYISASTIVNERVFELRKIVPLAMAVVALSLGCSILYSLTLPRYLFAFLILIVIVVERRYFINAIVNMKV